MTDSEGMRALTRAGWKPIRQRGSHVILARAGRRLVVACGRRSKHSLSDGQVAKIKRAARPGAESAS